jgi:hypothetical protein
LETLRRALSAFAPPAAPAASDATRDADDDLARADLADRAKTGRGKAPR